MSKYKIVKSYGVIDSTTGQAFDYFFTKKAADKCLADLNKPEWYYKDPNGFTIYDEKKGDAKATCWHCKKTFLCDPMDACCRLCGAPYAKDRCAEFGFKPKL
jgi:hypothetical protein